VEEGLPFVENGRNLGIISSIENPIALRHSSKELSVIGRW
jgi:hypothetical protein